MAEPAPVTERELLFGRIASVVIGLESAILTAMVVYYLSALFTAEVADPVMIIMTAIMFAIFAVGLGYASVGLWRRHPRAQAPAIAINILAVPLGISLFAWADWWIAAGVLILAVTVVLTATLMGQPGRTGSA